MTVIFNEFAQRVHTASRKAGWWHESDDNNPYTVACKLVLIHSEISEAMEGDRKKAMDDKLPHRTTIEVELADAIIRIGDLAGYLGLDLEGAIEEKLEYNTKRQDHKTEVRRSTGGKRY